MNSTKTILHRHFFRLDSRLITQRSHYYLPYAEVSSLDQIGAVILEYPLATLIVTTDKAPLISHVPFLYFQENNVLRGHISKANPIAKLPLDEIHACTAVFNGPSAYISPSWYESKKDGGKAVPTWNYVAVHMVGKCKLIDDSQWIYENVRQLSDHFEKQKNSDWQITDAPANYIRAAIRGIYGIEIQIHAPDGRFKLSQNRSEQDRLGVINRLNESSSYSDKSVSEWMNKVQKK